MNEEKEENLSEKLWASYRQYKNRDLEALKKELRKPEFKENSEFYRQMDVVQSFYSTRAVAHASFVVASIIGLFTILGLMITSYPELSGLSSLVVLGSLSVTYWGVFFIGLHSFVRFSLYAVYAQRAADAAAEQANTRIITFVSEQDEIKNKFGMRAGVKARMFWGIDMLESEIQAKVARWVKVERFWARDLLARILKRIRTTRTEKRSVDKGKLNAWLSTHNKGFYESAYSVMGLLAFAAVLLIILHSNHLLL